MKFVVLFGRYIIYRTHRVAVFTTAAAAGLRFGSDVFSVGNFGFYWSSAAYDKGRAYYLGFNSNNVYPNFYDDRSSGRSIRLITESK